VQYSGVGGLPGENCLAARLGHRQLDGALVIGGRHPPEKAARAQRVHDRRHRVGPHVEQPGKLARPRARVLDNRGKQLKLRHGEGVPWVSDTGATAQCAAQPGNTLGEAARLQAEIAGRLARHRGGHLDLPQGGGGCQRRLYVAQVHHEGASNATGRDL
jgi:hypothetical protein